MDWVSYLKKKLIEDGYIGLKGKDCKCYLNPPSSEYRGLFECLSYFTDDYLSIVTCKPFKVKSSRRRKDFFERLGMPPFKQNCFNGMCHSCIKDTKVIHVEDTYLCYKCAVEIIEQKIYVKTKKEGGKND